MGQNRCVCCNKVIPEGQHCCSWCMSNVTIKTPVVSEMSKGELTNEIVRLGNLIINLEKSFDQLSVGYLALCKKVGIRH